MPKILKDYHVASRMSLCENANVSKLPGVLCTLEGPLASFTQCTRNNRLYPRELWESILSSKEVQENLDTLTFYGESNHPFSWEERLDTHIPNVCINVRKLWIDDAKGELWGIIDVLDTPHGRIIKTLVDYGSKLGISSRGSGNVVNVKGVPTVDVASYYFVTFDLVVTPGNMSSRLSEPVTEEVPEITLSENSQSVVTGLRSQITEALSRSDTDALKSMNLLLEYSNLTSEFQDLTESIHKVLDESEEDDVSDTITDDATDDLLEAYQMISELESKVNELTTANSSHNERITYLTELCSQAKDTILQLNESLQDKTETISSYQELVTKVSEENKVLTESLDASNEKYNILVETNTKQINELNESNSQFSKTAKLLEDKVNQLVRENSEHINRLNRKHHNEVNEIKTGYESEVSELTNKVNTLTEKLTATSAKSNVFLNEYMSMRCKSLGLDRSQLPSSILTESIDTPEEIDTKLRSMMQSATTKRLVENAGESIVGSARLVEYSTHSSTYANNTDDGNLASISAVVTAVRGTKVN